MLQRKISGDYRNAVITWVTTYDFTTSLCHEEETASATAAMDTTTVLQDGPVSTSETNTTAEGTSESPIEEENIVLPPRYEAPAEAEYDIQMYVSGRNYPNANNNTIAVLFHCNAQVFFALSTCYFCYIFPHNIIHA
jgi:hypothetical protein